jgi:AcrR family transcriptional regulator
MARPRSEDRRNAILSAATRVIASQGLGASTAAIAKEAAVSNGSLFVYFDTKAALVNELYVALKTEMGTVATAGLPVESEPREQLLHVWTQWLRWATTTPEKRRALAQLEVSDEITAESHRTVSSAFGGIADLLERSRAGGPMQDVPLSFVLTLISAIADAAIDTILDEPAESEARSSAAFDAIWRVLASSSLPART